MNLFLDLLVAIGGAAVVITVILLFGLQRALRAAGKPLAQVQRIVFTLGCFLVGWLAIAVCLGWLGVFRTAVPQPVPYIALAIGVPIIIGALAIRGSRQVQEIIDAVPQSWLVAFQFYRVVGIIFLILYATGLLPGVFALPAGFGDLFVGLAAPLVGFRYARNLPWRDTLVALWNVIGIGDLVVAIATGFLSSPSRFQIFSLDAPNLLISAFPLVLIPIYAVPLSIVLHLASLTKLRRTQASARQTEAAVT
jgi:hypothetical protein